ncbi:MAG: indole-3-glycerol phosphate synthase TrpC [Nitrospirota bacterium]|nr:indole-3-glycerol phosphate synthase TrpC [Nitrospirota bacterium]
MSILRKIVEQKKGRVSYAKSVTSLSELKDKIKETPKPEDFYKAVKRNGSSIRLIAEVKKASPSKGLIRADFSHTAIASVYEEKKVDAVSVLTEEDFFQGRLEFLEDIKKIVSCPVLRKDFIFDEYQLYEARAGKADAVLLIAAILEPKQAEEFLHLAGELGLAVLFEVHDFAELETALRINVPVIGINNRNLKTLSIDLNTTFELKKEIPKDRAVVSESGIRTRADVLRLEEAGVDAMLIGTSLMESRNISGKIDELRGIV